ncbi:hypothetical protein M5689_007695 [Euphorbia peplus]|nr:hypothetical protein M5689_007695 [Euphorbia peplus]
MRCVKVSTEVEDTDFRGWSYTNSGTFNSASLATSRLNDISTETIWHNIWSAKVPHRIRSFAWLGALDRLLTNVERYRHHLVVSHQCSRCSLSPETLSHALRDCPTAKKYGVICCLLIYNVSFLVQMK